MKPGHTLRIEDIAAVTLDAGGTLVYPYPSVGSIYAEVLQRHGLHLPPDAIEAAFRSTWKSVQRSQNGAVSENSERKFWREIVRMTISDLGQPDDFDSLFEDLWNSFGDVERWRLHDGAIELIEGLRAMNVGTAILSNWDCRLRLVLDGMQLTTRFDAVVISSEVGIEKPHPGIFQHTESVLGLEPGQLLHVGDSMHHDADGARRAGWQALLVTHGGPDHEAVPSARDLVEVRTIITGK